jgi:hypothetical protein
VCRSFVCLFMLCAWYACGVCVCLRVKERRRVEGEGDDKIPMIFLYFFPSFFLFFLSFFFFCICKYI